MRRLVIAICSIAALGAGDPSADLPRLVERLGSPDYRDRQAAMQSLDRLGEPALTALRAVLRSSDVDLRTRANELIRRIEQRKIAAQILTPTKVELTIEDKPVNEAVRLLANLTGLSVQLAGNTSTLGTRKMTYKSGPVTTLEALRGFVAAANLTEWDGLTPTPGLPLPGLGASEPGIRRRAGAGVMIFQGNLMPQGREISGIRTIYLYDGSSTPPPTQYSGAVRVRALAVSNSYLNNLADSDEVVIPLQLLTEPKLNWRAAPIVKYAVAEDDLRQRLTANVLGLPGPIVEDDEFAVPRPIGYMEAPSSLSRVQYVALRLQRGERSAKSLREINGTLSLPLRVAGEIAAIENPMAGDGKEMQSSFGHLAVTGSRSEDGLLKIDLIAQLPSDSSVTLPVNNDRALRLQVQVQGNNIVQEYTATTYRASDKATTLLGISLADRSGNRFTVQQVNGLSLRIGDGTRIRGTFVFKATPDVAAPDRLTVTGLYPVNIELPFAFQDIPLP